MKVSVALGAWTLLAVLIWPCTESIYVEVRCSMDWVMISVSPCGYSGSVYIFADELYLGSGCPVTRIQTYAYDFIYPVHDCGIRIKVVSEDTLLFQTEMYFNPRNLHCDHQKIPLECSASRKSVWLTPVSTENEIKLDPSPFIADFETTPEELGLLSSSQTGFLLKEEWRLGTGVMNFRKSFRLFTIGYGVHYGLALCRLSYVKVHSIWT
ncbi:oocyte-secreted protein 2 [Phoca vitulina]|uniref:oocyte-secreted protein 2 n=1 Tax=Phoca vitulina TaxID=9720 RepID=UPI001395EFD9|nr:oocyte-secreted protein 2 [Phoca vitulina]